MTLLLIRHGHAGTRKEWHGDDRLRPLSTKGLSQATELAPLLAAWAPSRVWSSPSRRCVQTVRPLADRLRLKIEEVEGLAEGAGDEAVELMRTWRDGPIAMCTHGDVIIDILTALADTDHLALGPDPKHAKGSTWVFEAKRGKFVKATYLPPAGRVSRSDR